MSFSEHARPLSVATRLVLWLKFSLTWANSIGSGDIVRMRRLAWTFAVRICYNGSFPMARLIYCGCSLEAFCWHPNISFWYPRFMFSWRKKENNIYLNAYLTLYNYFIPFWATVKTIIPEVLWTTWWAITRGRSPRTVVHQVVLSTEGLIGLTVAQKGMM